MQQREAIIEDINIATPAAMFTGSLEEWTTKQEAKLSDAEDLEEEESPEETV